MQSSVIKYAAFAFLICVIILLISFGIYMVIEYETSKNIATFYEKCNFLGASQTLPLGKHSIEELKNLPNNIFRSVTFPSGKSLKILFNENNARHTNKYHYSKPCIEEFPVNPISIEIS
jgi:hypothetical protein